jgi:two-component system sensor histidine kinase QseC
LIDNAVRHTPNGTSVVVVVGSADGQASVLVSDNGPGIPATDMTRISERFYRPLGTLASGSGLGLSIAKRIADVHGASLTFASKGAKSGFSALVRFGK